MDQSKALDQAIDMTRQMLALAKNEEWEKLTELELERQKIIRENISDDHSVNKESEIGLKIQQILEIDQEVQSLVVKAHDEVRDEIIQLNKDKGAVKAYESK